MVPILLLAVVLNSVAVSPQTAMVDERRSLSGLSGVDIVVEQLDTTALAEGLTTDQLKTDVQLKLGSAGIKLGAKFEAYLDIEVFSLQLNDKTRQNMTLGYTAAVMMSLKQLVNLARHKGLLTWARTWQKKAIIYGPPGHAQEGVRKAVNDLVDKFIDDYLTTNPKS